MSLAIDTAGEEALLFAYEIETGRQLELPAFAYVQADVLIQKIKDFRGEYVLPKHREKCVIAHAVNVQVFYRVGVVRLLGKLGDLKRVSLRFP